MILGPLIAFILLVVAMRINIGMDASYALLYLALSVEVVAFVASIWVLLGRSSLAQRCFAVSFTLINYFGIQGIVGLLQR